MLDYYEVFEGPGINELRLKPPWAFCRISRDKRVRIGKDGRRDDFPVFQFWFSEVTGPRQVGESVDLVALFLPTVHSTWKSGVFKRVAWAPWVVLVGLPQRNPNDTNSSNSPRWSSSNPNQSWQPIIILRLLCFSQLNIFNFISMKLEIIFFFISQWNVFFWRTQYCPHRGQCITSVVTQHLLVS